MRTDEHAVKFPVEMYVGFNLRMESADEPKVRLGFATPVDYTTTQTETAASLKRKETVNNWAGYIFQKDSTIIVQNDYNAHTRRYDIVELKTADPRHPITIKNELIEGFKIVATKRRWGGWFSNKTSVWRVYDPRGFELEIYAANLAFIIDGCGISEGGIINGKCIWGRDSSGKNVLVPEASDTYQLSINKAEFDANRKYVPLKDIARGTIVEMEGHEYTYYGNVHLASIDKPYIETKISTRYLFSKTDANGKEQFLVKSSPKIDKTIVFFINGTVTPEDVAEKLNKLIRETSVKFDNLGYVVYASASKKELDNVKLTQSLVLALDPAESLLIGKGKYGEGVIKVNSKSCKGTNFFLLDKNNKAFSIKRVAAVNHNHQISATYTWNNQNRKEMYESIDNTVTLLRVENDAFLVAHHDYLSYRDAVDYNSKQPITDYTLHQLVISATINGQEVNKTYPLQDKE